MEQQFTENDLVWHDKLGVGRVALADAGSVLVEFEGGNEEMFEYNAKKSPPVKKLSGEGFVLRLRKDPEAMKALAAADPAAAIAAMHEDFGKTLDAALIKKAAGSAVPEGEWDEWWKRAVCALKTDPRFAVEKSGAVNFLGDMVALAGDILTNFKRASSLKEKQKICKEILRLETQGVPVEDAKEAAITFFTGTAASTTNTLGARLEALLFLKGLDEVQHDMVRIDFNAKVSSLNVFEAAEALAITADACVRSELLAIFEELLPDTFNDITAMLTKRFKKAQRDWILDTLINHKNETYIKTLLDAALADIFTNQQPYIWMGKRMFESPKRLIELGYDPEIVIRRFFKLLLENHITSAFSTDPKAGASVSREEDEIIKFMLKKGPLLNNLKQHTDNIVSLFGSLYMENTAIPDSERAEMIATLKEKYPGIEFQTLASPSEESETILTREAFDKYEQELADIIDVKLPENSEAIKTAREWGDISENAEYHAAKEKHSLLTGRKRQLERLLETAKVLDE